VKKRVEWIKWAKYPSLRRIKNVFYAPLHDISSQKVAKTDFLGEKSVPHAFLGEKSVQIPKFYLILFKFISLL